ncbi:MAG TPA: D-alanyl-D-alanine carboxypeptidase/D-alanyl-D-alanine-endopeptidase [Steroidobacteraceae bacterium]|nr:D-alanyl-D-alanine carboxypeptidase/D-alanyl-D-alanine-endopeptidase [Steroidobacteraceae bacterium]
MRFRLMMRPAQTLPAALLALQGAIAAAAVPTPVAQALAAERLPTASASFAVLDTESGRVIASLNADTERSPASTLKLVTTFAALDLLGPAYVWQTRALAHGELRDGVLEGDLILKGGGDPYMTLERWWSFVRRVREQGLKRIAGDIVIDHTAFALAAEDPGAFDGRPHHSYNSVPDALLVNFQSIEFRVVPNGATRTIDIVATPSPVNLAIDNRVGFAHGRCSASAARVQFEIPSEEWDRVVFSGRLSGECQERSLTRVLLRPESYAFGTFVELFRESGGQFDGKMRVAPAAADARPLVDFDSLSLAEIARLINKFSNNVMARQLLLTLGAERYGGPATLEKADRAVLDWWRGRGLPLEGLVIDNGSGLSRSARISALEMAAVLLAAFHSPYAPEFIASLPLAGLDGTLKRRMLGAPAGSVRLKTGHIDGVSGVAGYVTSASGKTYVLVSFVNDARADEGAGEAVHAALVEWIEVTL